MTRKYTTSTPGLGKFDVEQTPRFNFNHFLPSVIICKEYVCHERSPQVLIPPSTPETFDAPMRNMIATRNDALVDPNSGMM